MRTLFALLLLVGGLAHAESPAELEGRRIQFLIESLGNAEFVRNGSAYDAHAAADHLRLKLGKAGSRVATAEDFIRVCASVSSISGTAYQIRFSDGRLVTSEAFLRARLLEFDIDEGRQRPVAAPPRLA
jgi:hypothetical protein